MNEIIHQMFGLFSEKYYAVDSVSGIIIPSTFDYKSNALVSRIYESSNIAEIDMYQYYTKLETECNAERVKFMKEYLLGEKVTKIEKVHDNFIIGVEYALYNKDGKPIKSGTSEVNAKWCMASVLSDVMEKNTLEYRKGIVMDGHITIPVPEISWYGIRNAFKQYPYTLKISKVYAISTTGEYSYITEEGSQFDTSTCHCEDHSSPHYHANTAKYMRHHNALHDTNFNSCFITNAKIGTTIIDQIVTSAKLEVPAECEKIDVCTIECSDPEYIIKLNNNLKEISLNIEIFVDNFNEVYDRADIEKLLEHNSSKNDDVQDNPIVDEDEPDVPTDEELKEELDPPTNNENTDVSHEVVEDNVE